MDSVIVHEVFTSLQGETTEQGRPCTFVRLSACDLRCSWCDTPQAFTGGTRQRIAAIVDDVKARAVPFVTVTGGEPLLQPAAPALIAALLDAGFEVQVETGGHRDITVVDRRARLIMDIKAPGSGEGGSLRRENLPALLPHDQVKLVLASRADYEWARDVIDRDLRDFAGTVLLQPVTGVLDPTSLANWILADGLARVRFTLQLHALLWPGRTGV